MYKLSYSLYGSEKRTLGIYSSYYKAFKEMLDMFRIVKNAQCSDFYIENLGNGDIEVFNHDDLSLKAS